MTSPLTTAVDFSALYDGHHEYAARRLPGSFEHAQIVLETTAFKIPQLSALLRPEVPATSVMEIGCATGELIGHFPVVSGGRRVGCDISKDNVATAEKRFPDVTFFSGDFRDLRRSERFNYIILSDVLEHVEDDAGLLSAAADQSQYVLVNLPLEDNWLNRNRAYGPNDVSGHLRRYSLAEGLALFERAGLRVAAFVQVWAHEQPFDVQRRALRSTYQGHPYSGGRAVRAAKTGANALVRAMPWLGRRLYAANLFAIAGRRVP